MTESNLLQKNLNDAHDAIEEDGEMRNEDVINQQL